MRFFLLFASSLFRTKCWNSNDFEEPQMSSWKHYNQYELLIITYLEHTKMQLIVTANVIPMSNDFVEGLCDIFNTK